MSIRLKNYPLRFTHVDLYTVPFQEFFKRQQICCLLKEKTSFFSLRIWMVGHFFFVIIKIYIDEWKQDNLSNQNEKWKKHRVFLSDLFYFVSPGFVFVLLFVVLIRLKWDLNIDWIMFNVSNLTIDLFMWVRRRMVMFYTRSNRRNGLTTDCVLNVNLNWFS